MSDAFPNIACSACGASPDRECDCGAPFLPAGQVAALFAAERKDRAAREDKALTQGYFRARDGIASREEALDLLRSIRVTLAADKPLSHLQLAHVQECLGLVLDGRCTSLDAAFGLEPRRAGRPAVSEDKAVEWATAVHRARVIDDLSYDAAIEHVMAEFGRSRAPVKRAYKAHCIEGLQRFLRDLGRPLDEAEKERLRLSMSRIAAEARKLGLDIPR